MLADACEDLQLAAQRFQRQKPGVSQQSGLRLAAGKIHRKQYLVKLKTSGKTGQLSCLLSTFLSMQKAMAI